MLPIPPGAQTEPGRSVRLLIATPTMTAAEDAAQWVTQQGCHNYRDERKSVPTRPSMQPVCGRSAFPLIGRTHSQPFISRFPESKPCAFAERDSLCVAPQLSATSLSAERTFRYCHFYPLAPRSGGRQSASVSNHDRKTGSQSVSWITISSLVPKWHPRWRFVTLVRHLRTSVLCSG